MIAIPLRYGQVALIDDEDFERVSRFRWHLYLKVRNGAYYARRSIGIRGRFELLHRFILGLKPKDPDIDHKDRNGLNCQKDNLRIATHTQNQCNRGPTKRNKSGFKGVRFSKGHSSAKPWMAAIQVHKHRFELGQFATAEDAARAYDKAARENHGDFAYLNFPNEVSQ